MSAAGVSSRSRATTARGRPRKRTAEACVFCRQRKIKCNNELPACANCRAYHRTCVYQPTNGGLRQGQRPYTRRQRSMAPTSAVAGIDSLDAAADAASTSPVGGTSTSSSVGIQEIGSNPGPAAPPTQRSVSRIVFANGVSTYHGQTSALFEETQPDQPPEAIPRLPQEWVEKGLVAEAVKQRQMEEVNFAAGKLDFDGVDPEMGRHLLSLHWNRQHHSFLITYRPAFMRDMACNGAYFSKILLNAIYFGASKFSPRSEELCRDRNDPRTAGWRFRERVRELLGSALDGSDITTIQALLVMTNSLFALGDERSAAWLYAGLAFRMIIDLGIHVDTPDLSSTRTFTDEDLEIRRRVFWGAFVVDKIQSLYQGRPVSLQESNTRVPICFLDTYEELEAWRPFAYPGTPDSAFTGSPAYSVSTFTALCKLSVIMSDILSCIYAERSFDQDPSELSKTLESLHSRLGQWKEQLPPHLNFDTSQPLAPMPPPNVMSLIAMYNVLLILLHRPFVAEGHLYNTPHAISVNSFLTCATAAANIVKLLRAYDLAFSIRRAPYLMSYATYVSATIHVRIASKSAPGSEAHASLETCLAVFRKNQGTNWAVKRANMIVLNLMRRLGVVLEEDSTGFRMIPPSRDEREAANASTIGAGVDSVVTVLPAAQITSSTKASDNHPITPSNPDIDAIIQSFARAQQQDRSGNTTSRTNPGALPTASSEVYPVTHTHHYEPSIFQPNEKLHEDVSFAGGLDWMNANVMISSSTDDLLFGFNCSALDNLWVPE